MQTCKRTQRSYKLGDSENGQALNAGWNQNVIDMQIIPQALECRNASGQIKYFQGRNFREFARIAKVYFREKS